MALVDELKKKPGMYSAANAELADAAYKTGANYQNPVLAATRAALPNAPQGQMPGMFDVGTSGQRSLVGQKIIDPIKGFFAQSAAQARGEAVPEASAPARPLTAGIVPAANAAAPNPTQQPAVSDAYADEGQRGAAKTALSQLANVPAQRAQPALPNGYRVSDTSVSGVKRVDGGSSPLFTNIDPGQAVSEMKGMKSGTGTIGADGSNFSLANGKPYQGRFVNSGYEGAGVAPNTDPAFREQASREFIGNENRQWAQDFNKEAQRRLAGVQEYQGWAPGGPSAIAQQYRVDKNGELQGYEIDKQGKQYAMGSRQAAAQQYSDAQTGSSSGGVIWNPSAEATNAQFRASREQEAMKNMGRAEINAMMQQRGIDAQRERMNAEMGLRGRELESNEAYRRGTLAQQASQTDLQRERLGIDRQEVGARALTAGINDRKSQAEMAEMQRIGKLRDAYMAEQDPAKKEQMGRALLTLQGKEPSQPRDEETNARYGLISELAKSYDTMPPTGPDGKPIPFDQYAGPVLQMANGNRGGNGQQQQFPDAAIQALRANPKLAADFDAKYGQGASRQFIQ